MFARVARVSRRRSSFGPGVRALVRAHAAGAVRPRSARGRRSPAACSVRPSGPRVVLRVRPQRGLAVAGEHALQLPAARTARPPPRRGPARPAGRSTATTLNGERASSSARWPCVDHVVGRRDDVGERPGDRRCRSAARAAVWTSAMAVADASSAAPGTRMPTRGHYPYAHGAWRSLVAHLLWEQGVAGSNPAAPIIR